MESLIKENLKRIIGMLDTLRRHIDNEDLVEAYAVASGVKELTRATLEMSDVAETERCIEREEDDEDFF